jgi:hypothetical protein
VVSADSRVGGRCDIKCHAAECSSRNVILGWVQALLEFVKLLLHHVVDVPVKMWTAFLRIFPKTDHYRFNVIIDLIAAGVFVYSLHQSDLPGGQKGLMVLVGVPSLCLLFAWCFMTSIDRS